MNWQLNFLPDCPNRLLDAYIDAGKPTKKVFLTKLAEKPWTVEDHTISNYPYFLNGAYFVQLPLKWSTKGKQVSIDVTGSAFVSVAIEKDSDLFTGGYEKSLPQEGWKKEVGEIVAEKKVETITLGRIFSKKFHYNSKKSILLPTSTTVQTIMMINVVPICTGNY